MFHPRIRVPLWAAAAIAAAAYVVRSVARGLDFRPDLPEDAIALVLLVVMIALVAGVRAWAKRDDDDQPPKPDDAEDEG